MLPLFVSLSSALAAPAAWVVEPGAPAIGLRLAPSDRVQIDATLGPELSWSRSASRSETRFGGSPGTTEQSATRTAWGATLRPTLRLWLADAATAATISVGGGASVGGFRDSLVQGEEGAPVSGKWSEGRAWVGAGVAHRWAQRWSVGGEVELLALSVGESTSDGEFQGIPFNTTANDLAMHAAGGLHVWVARTFRARE